MIRVNRNYSKAIAASMMMVALALPACNNETATDTTTDTTATEENVITEEVSENFESYVGETVTVRSNALEKLSPTTFVLSDQQFWGGDNIVVVNASGEPQVLPDDAEIQVTGEVREFVLADIESEYGVDLGDEDLYVEYENQPAIIAESMAVSPDPGEITQNPAQYYGQTLAVAGEVEQIYGDNVFSLDEEELIGAEDLLVLVVNPEETITEGEKVAVTGELREFVIADIERDYEYTWDADLVAELEAEYSDRPVLVVRQVYPSAVFEAES